MKELENILQVFLETQQRGEKSFLATVVNTTGSTYRQPGAKLLLLSTGEMVGMISGGCLEKDIFEYTRQEISDHEAILITYDHHAPEDILWGFGLGCDGMVSVLLEPLYLDNPVNPLTFLIDYWHQQMIVIATVFRVHGSINAAVGQRLLLCADGISKSDIADADLVKAITTDAQRQRQSRVIHYQFADGSVEVFLECLQPPTPLIIFGAQMDALPLAQCAKNLGWQVTIVDCRANEASKQRFAFVDQVILTRREIIEQQIDINEQTVAVIMTHNYLDDLEILKLLLPSKAFYIGALGTKSRAEKLLVDVKKDKVFYTETQLNRFYAPVGLDIGANNPEAIAIAIIAEIQAVTAHRCGGFLKKRNQPIHSQ